MKKRILSFILATVMAVTSMPLVSFAETVGGTEGDNIIGNGGNPVAVDVGNASAFDGYRFSVTMVELDTPIPAGYTYDEFKEKSIEAVQHTYDHCLPVGADKAIYCFNGSALKEAGYLWYVNRGPKIFNENLPASLLPFGSDRAEIKGFTGGVYVGSKSSTVAGVNGVITDLKTLYENGSLNTQALQKAASKVSSDAGLRKEYLNYFGWLATGNMVEGAPKLNASELNAFLGIDTGESEFNAMKMLFHMYTICNITGTDYSGIDDFLDKYKARKRITHIPMIQIESLLGCATTLQGWAFSASVGQLIGYCADINDNAIGAKLFDPDNGVTSSTSYVNTSVTNGSLLDNITQYAFTIGSRRIQEVVRDVTSGRIYYDPGNGNKNIPARIKNWVYQTDADSTGWTTPAWGYCCSSNQSIIMNQIYAQDNPYQGYSFCWPFYIPADPIEYAFEFNAAAIWEEKVDDVIVETTDIERQSGTKVGINSYYYLTGDASKNTEVVQRLDPNYEGDDAIRSNVTLEVSLYTSELVPVGVVNPKKSRWTTHHYITDTPNGSLAGGGNVPIFCGDRQAVTKFKVSGTSVDNKGGHTVTATLTPRELQSLLNGETAIYFKSEHFSPWVVPDEIRYKTESAFQVKVTGLAEHTEDKFEVPANNLYITPYGVTEEYPNSMKYSVTEDELFPTKDEGYDWGTANSSASNAVLGDATRWHFVTEAQDKWQTDIKFVEAGDYLTRTMDLPDSELPELGVYVTCSYREYINNPGISWSIAVPEKLSEKNADNSTNYTNKVLNKLALASATSFASAKSSTSGATIEVTLEGDKEQRALRDIIRNKTEWSIYGCIVSGTQTEDAMVTMTYVLEVFEVGTEVTITGAPTTVTKHYPVEPEALPKASVVYHVAAKPDAYVFKGLEEGKDDASTPKRLFEHMEKSGDINSYATISVELEVPPQIQHTLYTLQNKVQNGSYVKIAWSQRPTGAEKHEVFGNMTWNEDEAWGARKVAGGYVIDSVSSLKKFISELIKEDTSWSLSYDVNQNAATNPEMGHGDDVLKAFAIDFLCDVEMVLIVDGKEVVVPWTGDPPNDPASWLLNIGFTYNSAIAGNYAEIKEGVPLQEQYEATSAVPTDRALYYAAGGTEFLIVSEFELNQQGRDGDKGAIRKYEIGAETVLCNHDFFAITYRDGSGSLEAYCSECKEGVSDYDALVKEHNCVLCEYDYNQEEAKQDFLEECKGERVVNKEGYYATVNDDGTINEPLEVTEELAKGWLTEKTYKHTACNGHHSGDDTDPDTEGHQCGPGHYDWSHEDGFCSDCGTGDIHGTVPCLPTEERTLVGYSVSWTTTSCTACGASYFDASQCSVTITPVYCDGHELVEPNLPDTVTISFETATKSDSENINGVAEEGNLTNCAEESYSVDTVADKYVPKYHCKCHCGTLHKPCATHTQTYKETWTTEIGKFPYMSLKSCQVWRLEENKMQLNEDVNITDEIIVGGDMNTGGGTREYGKVYIYRGKSNTPDSQSASGRLIYSWHPEATFQTDTLNIYQYMCLDNKSPALTIDGKEIHSQGGRSYENFDTSKEYPERYEKDVEFEPEGKWYTSTVCTDKHAEDADGKIHSTFKGAPTAFVENHGLVYYKFLQYLDPKNSEEGQGEILGTAFTEGDSYGESDGGRMSVTIVSDFIVLFGHDETVQLPYYHEYTIYPTLHNADYYNSDEGLSTMEVSNSDGVRGSGKDQDNYLSTYEFVGFGESYKAGSGSGVTVDHKGGRLDVYNTGTLTVSCNDSDISYYTTAWRKNNTSTLWSPPNTKTGPNNPYVLKPDFFLNCTEYGSALTDTVVGRVVNPTADDQVITNDFWFYNSTSNSDSNGNDGLRELTVGIPTDGIMTAGYNGNVGEKYLDSQKDLVKYRSVATGATFANRTDALKKIGLAFLYKPKYMVDGEVDNSLYALKSSKGGSDNLRTFWFSGKIDIPIAEDAVNQDYIYNDAQSKCFYNYLSTVQYPTVGVVPVHGGAYISWAGKNGFEVNAPINDIVVYDPIAVQAGVTRDGAFHDQRTEESRNIILSTNTSMNVESGGVFKFSLVDTIQEQALDDRGFSSTTGIIADDIRWSGKYYTNNNPKMNTIDYCRAKYIIADNFLIVDTNGNGSFADEKIYEPGDKIPVQKYKFDENRNKVPLEEYAFYIPSMAHEMKVMTVQFVAETINDPDDDIYNTAKNNVADFRDGDALFARHHEAVDKVTITVVGRIGNLTMVDSGDFRYATFFKCVSGIAGDWLVPNVVQGIDASKQNSVVIDTYDIYQNKYGSDNTHYNTYGSQAHKYAVDALAKIDSSTSQYQFLGRPNYFSFPLIPEYNNVTAFRTAPPRVGYTTYLDIETIGEYYTGDSYVTVEYAYYGLPASGDDLVPLDVFMWRDDEYVLINDFYNTRDEELYSYPILMNWADSKVRRMYTAEEARRTEEVNNNWTDDGYLDMYSKTFVDTNYISEKGPNGYSTYQGDCETAYLGYDSRTFIGNYIYDDVAEGFSNNNNTDVAESVEKWMFYRDSQKWYFSNELPSSAVFVRAGEHPTEENIEDVKDNYPSVVVTAYIIAHGPVWDLEHDGLPSWGHLREWYPDIPDDPVYPPTDPNDPLDPDEPDDPDNPDDPDDPDDPPDDPPPPTVIMIIPPDKSSRDDLDTSGTH